MATRPGPVPVTAAVVADVLLAALGIVGGPAVRSTIGAGTSSVSLPGTGVVVAHAGDAGTLDAAGAADGAVVAIVSGVPTLTTVSTVTAYDPTTRHGEISVRVDAGGADVTALAPVAPGTAGQVLTVSDAGLPHWAAAAGGTVTAYTAADFTPTQGHASTSASIVSGRLRLSIDAAVRRYGTVAGAWTTTAPRGVLTVPAGAREVVAITRVYTDSGTTTSYLGVSTALRGGTDPSDITDLAVMSGTRLPGTVHWDTGPAIYGGELRDNSYPASTYISVVQWAAAPTPYYGVRWTRGSVTYVGAATGASSPDDVYGYPVAGLAPDWPVPTEVIVTLQQYSGATAAQIDVEIFVWVWT